MSDAFTLTKETYTATLLFLSGEEFESSWIEFFSETPVRGATWGTIKQLFR